MGVPGMVGALKKNQYTWGENYILKDTHLVIDATHLISWKKYHLKMLNPNDYGGNMVEFANYWQKFFEYLAECKVTPIVVYDGAHLEEPKHSTVASKQDFMKQSCKIRIDKLKRYGANLNDYILPELALNVFKIIVSQLRVRQIEQSRYESYPLVASLANNLGCAVLTNHSDLILTNVKGGLIWSDNFDETKFICNSIPCTLYSHSKFLADPDNSDLSPGITTVLYAILRGDFVRRHRSVLRSLLPGFCEGRGSARGNFQIAIDWLRRKNLGQIREILTNMANVMSDTTFIQDFESIYESYTTVTEFKDGLPGPYNNDTNVILARLKQGQLNVQFLMDLIMKQTHLDRGPIEDTGTKRSSFSMQDLTRSLLLRLIERDTRANNNNAIDIYDRTFDNFRMRTLMALNRATSLNDLSGPTSSDGLLASDAVYDIFGMGKNDRIQLTDILAHIFDEETSQQIMLMLLMLKFIIGEASNGCRTFRDDYRNIFKHFLLAIYNSFLYYAKLNNTLEATLNGLINGQRHDKENGLAPSVRMLEGFITSRNLHSCSGASKTGRHYIKLKHLVELMNSVLLAYCELNSILGSPCPTLKLDRYYNAVLIFRLADYSLKEVQDRRNFLISDIVQLQNIVLSNVN